MSQASKAWRAAVATVLLVPVLMLLPSLRPGHVLSASDGLLDAYLMEEARPEGHARANRLTTDPYRQFVPWRSLVNHELLSGRMPFWNPYSYAGAPLLGNVQSGVFDPLSLPYLLASDRPERATAWVALLRLWVAGLGALVLARRLGAGPVGSALAGVAYSCSGFTITFLLSPHTSSSAWIPWAFVAADRLVERPARERMATLAVVLALSLFGGHPEVAFYGALGASAYALAFGSLESGFAGARAVLRRLAIAGLICVALTAVQILPFVEALLESGVLDDRTPVARFDNSFQREALVTQVFPFLAGRPLRGEVAIWNPGPPFTVLVGAYVSVLGILLAVYGLVTSSYGPRRRALGGVGLVAWAYYIGIPPLLQLGAHIPILNHAPSLRVAPVAVCAFAVLAGLGLDGLLRLAECPPGVRRVAQALAVLAGGAVLLGTAMIVDPETLVERSEQLLNNAWGQDLFGSRLEDVLSQLGDVLPKYGADFLIPWGVIAGASAFVLVKIRRDRRRLGWVTVGIVAADLLYIGLGYNPAIEQRLAFPEVEAIERIRVEAGAGRALILGGLPANAATFYRLQDVAGYDVLDRGRLGRLLRVAGPFPRYSNLRHPGSWPYDLLGVRVITTSEPIASDHLVPLGGIGGGYIYRNPRALPMAFTPREIVAVSDPEAAERILRAEDFAPDEVAAVEGSGDRVAAVLRSAPRISRPTASSLRVELGVEAAGLVVVSESYSIGWRAAVAGKQVEVLPADLALMAVPVPAGAHTLEMTYRPRSWLWALGLTAMGALVVLFWTGRSMLRSSPDLYRDGMVVRDRTQ